MCPHSLSTSRLACQPVYKVGAVCHVVLYASHPDTAVSVL